MLGLVLPKTGFSAACQVTQRPVAFPVEGVDGGSISMLTVQVD
jgi:hypothetical protein